MNDYFWTAIGIALGIAAFGIGYVRGIKAGWAWHEENQQKEKNKG